MKRCHGSPGMWAMDGHGTPKDVDEEAQFSAVGHRGVPWLKHLEPEPTSQNNGMPDVPAESPLSSN